MALESPIDPDDEWYYDEDKVLSFTVFSDPKKGTKEDITGWTFKFELVDGVSNAVILTKDSGAGIEVFDAPNGIVHTTIAAGDLSEDDLSDSEEHRYVFWRMDAGFVGVLAYGHVTIKNLNIVRTP